MSNNDSGKNVVRAHRKPVVATVRKRERTVMADNTVTLLTKKEEIVIRRPANTQAMQMAQEVSAKQVQQPGQAQSMGQMQQQASQVQSTNQTQSMGQMQHAKRIQGINTRMAQRKAAMNMRQTARPTSQEIKQQAISQALAKTAKSSQDSKKKSKNTGIHFGFKRIALATACALVAVCAIVFFVNLNAPNISLKVAAMQSGIEASYPAYVPRDYNITDITSENGKITLNFRNSSADGAFSLIEERSSWDSNALLNNYVKPTYGDNYTLVREQGLALYISGSDASWVNGGVVYKLKTTSGTLNKKQIKSIAVSL